MKAFGRCLFRAHHPDVRNDVQHLRHQLLDSLARVDTCLGDVRAALYLYSIGRGLQGAWVALSVALRGRS